MRMSNISLGSDIKFRSVTSRVYLKKNHRQPLVKIEVKVIITFKILCLGKITNVKVFTVFLNMILNRFGTLLCFLNYYGFRLKAAVREGMKVVIPPAYK